MRRSVALHHLQATRRQITPWTECEIPRFTCQTSFRAGMAFFEGGAIFSKRRRGLLSVVASSIVGGMVYHEPPVVTAHLLVAPFTIR